MGTKIECPLCRKVQKDWRAYAEHLLEEHTEDEDRCQWARAMTKMSKNKTKPEEPIELRKIRGKPAEMISPPRELPKKIPDYLRKQLGG